MIHETVDRRNREHDQLAAMVMRELRDRELFASVIHTTVSTESYALPPTAPPGSDYRPVREKQGKLNGYLRNVAITKILLTNERWPFVLATPLHADMTIAVDVQLNTACFAFFGQCGADIRTVQKTSTQKVLRQEVGLGRKQLRSLVVQRDGRLFATEIAGVREAVRILVAEGNLPTDVSLNFVEIPKKSAAPVRLFEPFTRPGGKEGVDNPQVGSYYLAGVQDGYLCTTGREFSHPGTTNPLHVRYRDGSMPIEHILEDVYAFACLAWTRPEDCSRTPVSLKLADIRLREHAGGYDEDALEYGDEADEGQEVTRDE
jgi:argonaute-like protein implicated in RNA metabolism and viral defense